MFKRYLTILIIIFVIISTIKISAEDLTINAHHTYLVDSLGSEIIFSIDLINNSSQEMGITIVRNVIDMPASWWSSLCLNNCYPPHLDSISTSANFGLTPLESGESREMSLHVFPREEDAEAVIELKFVNEQNPSEQYIQEFRAASTILSVDDKSNKVYHYNLNQNFPNPFNPSTNINYSIGNLTHSSEFVTLKVFDILGREVATLVNSTQSPGSYSIKFYSNNLSSGIYFYELKTNHFHEIKKMILER